MDKYYIIAIIMGLAIALVGLVYTLKYIYRIVEVDARARGIKRPKFWAFLTMAGNRGEGILLYLIKRRKYPADIRGEDRLVIDKNKARIKLSFAFLCLGAIILVWSLIFYL